MQELGAGDGWEGLDDQGDWAVENEELLSAASRTTTIGIDEYDSNTSRSTAEQGVNRAASPPPLLDFNAPLGGGSSGGSSRSSSKGGTVYMQGGAR